MISDDTEHTLMLAQSLLESPDDPGRFQRGLARRLRWWLAALPAGVGLATLRSILRLWMGVPPDRSGVISAGNGAAMRSALLGVYFAGNRERRRAFVEASTQITHRDPRAGIAALAVAETAAWMSERNDKIDVLLRDLAEVSTQPEWIALIGHLQTALALEHSVGKFAQCLGAHGGVSGYAFQSVPVAIYAAVRHRDDIASALSEVIACGGDTDTTGAITGALVGARIGVAAIPQSWRDGILDYPHSIPLLHCVAKQLSLQTETTSACGPVRCFWPAIPVRNFVFLCVVIAHGVRRMLPPY